MKINWKDKIDILFSDTFLNTGPIGPRDELTGGTFFLQVIMLSKL
jgi:hypothetical protein